MTDSLCMVINENGEVVYCNPTGEKWLGGQDRRLTGSRIQDWAHPLLKPFLSADWQLKARSERLEQTLEWQIEGTIQPVRACLAQLQVEGEAQPHYLYQATKVVPKDTCLLKLRLQRIQELARIGSWELNLKTFQAIWSDQARQLIGVTEDEPACPETLLNQIHPDDRTRVAAAMQEAIEKRHMYDIEYRVMHPDKEFHALHSRADFVYDETSEAWKLIGFVQDITDRKFAEERLRLSAKIFDGSLNPIIIFDIRGVIQQINRVFTQTTGYLPHEVIGESVERFQSRKTDQAFYDYIWQIIETEGQWEGEIWCRRKNGEDFPVWQSISSVREASGRITHYINTFIDITEQKLSADYIYQLSHYDLLTGLPNRVLFSERCRHAIERAKRNLHNTALLYLDLDRFKQINDSLGHPVGDELLEQVARRLKETLREEDTIARLGGDEFVIVVERIGDERGAERVASKIQEVLRTPFQLKHHELVVSTSIGISLCPMDGNDVATLIKHADLAMYRAKEKGRDNFQFFSLELSQGSMEYHLLESDLRHALERGELQLYYQPQYDLKSGRLVGAEALLRWRHRRKGLLSPNVFIPIAEESGLIVPIGEWALNTACRQTKSWRNAGIELERISVNLSGQQIQRGNIVESVRRTLEETELPPGCLELEILETYIMRQIDQDILVFETLRDLGVHLAIDDFGTGQSSLSYLKRLPVGKLKIDRSFVTGIPTNNDDAAITKAIVALGKSMQMTVIAEGVEHERHVTYLKGVGCDEAQGYYYSAPVDAERFEELARSASPSPVCRLGN
jgi:diguanylate cyclase (GGDEF)-like protein/PAS domain S-box-containing protein